MFEFLMEHIKWIGAILRRAGKWAFGESRQRRQQSGQVQAPSDHSVAYQAGRDNIVFHQQHTPAQELLNVQVKVHRAFKDKTLQYFVKVVNLTATRDIVITHVWYQGSRRIDILNQERPLPKRMPPLEPWETWVAVNSVPLDSNIFGNFRVKLSTGDEFPSVENKDIPPSGFIAGALGLILQMVAQVL